LDEIILFKPLTRDNISDIMDLMITDLNKRLADREITIVLTEAAKAHAVARAYDPMYGARPLKRFLQKNVETLSARLIISDQVHPEDTIIIDEAKGVLTASVRVR
jgi:ATP-dependent Clp protease ATP-binding subunit ClpB